MHIVYVSTRTAALRNFLATKVRFIMSCEWFRIRALIIKKASQGNLYYQIFVRVFSLSGRYVYDVYILNSLKLSCLSNKKMKTVIYREKLYSLNYVMNISVCPFIHRPELVNIASSNDSVFMAKNVSSLTEQIKEAIKDFTCPSK